MRKYVVTRMAVRLPVAVKLTAHAGGSMILEVLHEQHSCIRCEETYHDAAT